MNLQSESKRPELKIPHNYHAAEHEADKVAEGFKHSADVRGDVGRRLGLDFSSVKIHEGTVGAAKTDSVGAPAMTQGQNIYLGGNVEADSGATRSQVIAHELVHTAQQTQGGGMSESVPAGSTQMWNPFKKKKKDTAAKVKSRAGQGGQFVPLDQAQKDQSFTGGFRTGFGPGIKPLIQNTGGALSGWQKEVDEYMVAKKTDLFGKGTKIDPSVFDGMNPLNGFSVQDSVTQTVGFDKPNQTFANIGGDLLDRLMPHLEDEGIQDYIRAMYGNTGGRAYEEARREHGTNFDQYMFSSFMSRGFDRAPDSISAIDKRQTKDLGMKNFTTQSGSAMSKAGLLITKKLRGEVLTEPEEHLLQKVLPVFQKFREIGQGSIRPGLDLPMTDLSSLLPQQSSPPSYSPPPVPTTAQQQSSPPSYSPPPVPTTAPLGVKQQFGYQQRAQEIGSSFNPETAQDGDFKAFAYKKLLEAKNTGNKEQIRYWAGIIAQERNGRSVWDDITPSGGQQPAQPSSPAPAKKKKGGWSLFGKKK